MNRFGPSVAEITSNLQRRWNALSSGQLPHIDDCLEAMSYGESPQQIEALEQAAGGVL